MRGPPAGHGRDRAEPEQARPGAKADARCGARRGSGMVTPCPPPHGEPRRGSRERRAGPRPPGGGRGRRQARGLARRLADARVPRRSSASTWSSCWRSRSGSCSSRACRTRRGPSSGWRTTSRYFQTPALAHSITNSLFVCDPEHRHHGAAGVRVRVRADAELPALEAALQDGGPHPHPGAVAPARPGARLPLRQPGPGQGPAPRPLDLRAHRDRDVRGLLHVPARAPDHRHGAVARRRAALRGGDRAPGQPAADLLHGDPARACATG